MSFDLHLKSACGGCGSTSDLYGSNCKHLTLCMACGKKMAENRSKCYDCGVPVSRLIRVCDKSYFVGRFVARLPNFSKKKNSDKKWTNQKEELQGRHVTDNLRDEEDEDEEANEEEGGGLSKSGKELKKLLGKTSGMNESDAEDDDDDDDDEIGLSPVLAPKQKDAVKEEPVDNSPSKTTEGSPLGIPSTSKSVKAKRKSGSDVVKAASVSPPAKKVKTENESKSSSKDGSASSSEGSNTVNEVTSSAGPVTEDEIRAVLLQKPPVTTEDLVAKFRARLKSPKDKMAFAEMLKKISKIWKTNGSKFVVLR